LRMLISNHVLSCAMALTRQRIITSLVFNLGASSLTQHLTGYGVRGLRVVNYLCD
jgi:hypothetical protein